MPIPRAVLAPVAVIGVVAGLWAYHGWQVRSAYTEGKSDGIEEQLTRQMAAERALQARLFELQVETRATARALLAEQQRRRVVAERNRDEAIERLGGSDRVAIPREWVCVIDGNCAIDPGDSPAP
ncbi:MAG: hypothetical protein AAFQ36_09410 [Pseudomonadota bacterium]